MKKALAIFLAAVLAIGVLAGCSGGGNNSQGNNSQSQASTPANSQSQTSQATSTPSETSVAPVDEAPFEITTLQLFYETEPPNYENNPILDFVEEQFNFKMVFTWCPNGEGSEKFLTMMAGSNPCMIMSGADVTSEAYYRYATGGALWDITDLMEEPQYQLIYDRLMSKVQKEFSLTDGRRYCLPGYVPDARIAMIYREDWVENLGITLPDIMTVQDYYDLAKAFTENDPDGDGVANTTGFNYVDDQDKEVSYGFDTVAVAHGAPNRFGVRDGKVVAYFMTEEYYDTLEWFQNMYKNGYLNSNFMELSSGRKWEPITVQDPGSITAGYMFTTATNSCVPGGKFDTLVAVHPEAKIGYKLLSLTPKGEKVVNSNITGLQGGYVFPVSAVGTEENMRHILDIIVGIHSNKETAKALDIGLKDMHYTENADGTITISEEQATRRVNDGGKIFENMIPRRFMADDWGQPISAWDQIQSHYEECAQYAIPDISIGQLSVENTNLLSELASIIYDARPLVIEGSLSIDDFKVKVDEWLQLGGQGILDELTANIVG